MSIDFSDAVEGDLGTVDIGGSGIGGSDGSSLFINDGFTAKINGASVSTSDTNAEFSFRLATSYLNVRLFDPNPDKDLGTSNNDPERGLSLAVSQTSQPFFRINIIDPAPLAGTVPEPASAAMLLGIGGLGAIFARRRARKALA